MAGMKKKWQLSMDWEIFNMKNNLAHSALDKKLKVFKFGSIEGFFQKELSNIKKNWNLSIIF